MGALYPAHLHMKWGWRHIHASNQIWQLRVNNRDNKAGADRTVLASGRHSAEGPHLQHARFALCPMLLVTFSMKGMSPSTATKTGQILTVLLPDWGWHGSVGMVTSRGADPCLPAHLTASSEMGDTRGSTAG